MTVRHRNLVGRDALLADVAKRIESDVPLLTVVGAPGVGKSILARTAIRDAKIDTSVVCDVSTVRDKVGFLNALANALRVETEGEITEAIVASLRRRRPVVLLDGFDQVVPIADATVGWLADVVPEVLWVVTSREPLHLPGEDVVNVEPLDHESAVALLQEHAPATFGTDEAASAGQLVDRLDRNPLAIELAAARLGTFSPDDLLERLDRRFKLLRSRHGASLEDAIAVSWELLDAHEQSALSQCTVFRGGFDLAAAEEVLTLHDDAPWVLDVVQSLVEKSLITKSATGRLDLAESIRAFVDANRTTDEPLQRHAAYYLSVGTAELGNLRAVVDRCEHDAPDHAARAALALHGHLRHGGLTQLHQDILARGIASARAANEAAILGQLLQAAGELGVVTGDLPQARVVAAQAVQHAHDVRDWRTYVRAQVQLAEVARRTGHAADGARLLGELLADDAVEWSPMPRRFAQAHYASCLVDTGDVEHAESLLMRITPAPSDADAGDEYQALKRLAYAHYYLGNHEEQQRLSQAALQVAKSVPDRRRVARALQGLGDAAFARRDFVEARRQYEAALAEHRELGNEHLTGVLLGNLGSAEHRSDDLESAAERYHEALLLHRRTGALPYEAVVHFALGVLEHERGAFDDAAFHYRCAEAQFAELDQSEDVVATNVALGWLLLQRQDSRAADEVLADVRTEDPRWRAVVARSRALATGQDWEDAAIAGSDLVAMLARALGALLRGEPVDEEGALRTTLQGRLILGLSQGSPQSTSVRPAPRAALIVGAQGQWFQAGGDIVSLRRRKAHRRILADLADRYERGGGPLDVYDAFELGWPGEQVAPEIAAERVYWVVGVLRRLGLDELLLTSDEGYYLDPDQNVRWAEPGEGK